MAGHGYKNREETKKQIDKMKENADFSKFVKFDSNKPAYELINPFALNEIVKVLTYGANKYNAHNWCKCTSITRYFGACLRHLFSWLGGEDTDPESGFLHLAHAGCCIFFMLGLHDKYGKEVDDRINVK